MQPFEWISWEAAATLITGILAVGAAIYVGRRQAGIAATQADIQRDQLRIQEELRKLEELKLRTELFDKRVEVYDATRDWIGWIVAYAKTPGSRLDGKPPTEESRKVARDFNHGVDRSRFLFRPEVFIKLNKLRRDGLALNLAQNRYTRSRSDAAREKAVDDENEILQALSVFDGDLSRAFGDELTLSIHGTVWENDPAPQEEEDVAVA